MTYPYKVKLDGQYYGAGVEVPTPHAPKAIGIEPKIEPVEDVEEVKAEKKADTKKKR